jgi:hypothetical protein
LSLIGMQSFLLMRKLTLLCAQACHLVEKLNLQILFVVQGNGKRRICNVEKNGRSLDRAPEPCSMSLSFEYQFFSHDVVLPALHEKIATPSQATAPAEVLYYVRLHEGF